MFLVVSYRLAMNNLCKERLNLGAEFVVACTSLRQNAARSSTGSQRRVIQPDRRPALCTARHSGSRLPVQEHCDRSNVGFEKRIDEKSLTVRRHNVGASHVRLKRVADV